MTSAPANILDLDAGTLTEGGPADITIFDPKAEWTVDPEQFASKSRNTPFTGATLRGRVVTTLCDGVVVYQHDAPTPASIS